MAVTNNNQPLIDLPMWEVLQPIGVATLGVCLTADPRGTDRFIYAIYGPTSFWRYDIWANTWQQLANVVPSTGLNVGTCMEYDANYGAAGSVWLLVSNGVNGFFSVYDIATNVWTAKSVTSGPVNWSTDGALAHTCSALNGAANNDFIYLVGNNATALYRYSISGDSWTTRAVAPATILNGCGITWIYDSDVDKLIAVRGATTPTVYVYSISGNSWSTLAYLPNIETFTTGSYVCLRSGDLVLVQKDVTGRVFQLDVSALTMTPLVTQYVITPSTAIVGKRMLVVRIQGIEYLYMLVHSTTAFVRTALFF